MKFNIEVEITQNQIEDLIVGALEGGSNYWLSFEVNPIIKDFKWNSIDYARQIVEGECELICYDVATKEYLGRLNKITIEEGLNLMLKTHPSSFKEILDENWDADTADVFMQCCVLKDIIYG